MYFLMPTKIHTCLFFCSEKATAIVLVQAFQSKGGMVCKAGCGFPSPNSLMDTLGRDLPMEPGSSIQGQWHPMVASTPGPLTFVFPWFTATTWDLIGHRQSTKPS